MIPAGHARLWPMQAGQRVTIVQTLGQQVGDLIALNGADLTEFLSPSHTRRCLAAWRIHKGQALFTNRRREIVELVEDTVGIHDILAPACDPHRDLRDWRIPDPVNLFQNSPVQSHGRFLSVPSTARVEDSVTLRARIDLIAACSACPQDLVPTNAGRLSDLRVTLD